MDAGQRSEGYREAHGLQSRRGSHERPGQGRPVDPLGRGVLHGRDDARLQLDVGRRQILGHRPQETAFGQRPGDDVPVALPQLHAAAFRRERLQHAHEDAARTVGERQVEPRLPDGRQVHRRGIRQQPAPPDGFDRDHRQVQLRGAAGHLQETLSGCQQLRIQVRGQRRPRNAQTAR